ncbi:1-aminocyclopropane-1-carboxylate deaminase/D-cysteine desulfhydrase [Pricia sp.]|uniref:1-aminocyclopropane-1-carboxylate deaminase/D-cysteine desulfhydrase n=1 Tax=Pricia sp. TaxID=2268138 RepID=UPI003593CD15
MQEKTVNQKVSLPVLTEKQVSLTIKREDLIHPLISGNKFRKLKFNLIEAKKQGRDTILTFGGAYSNHIAATAYAGKLHGFKTIGIIRGEELSGKWEANPTLQLASEHGMRFRFISRDDYRKKENPSYLKKLQSEFGSCHIVPEGGTNTLAIRGCEEILTPGDAYFDVVCCPVGTGGTLAGILNSAFENQLILGFPALKSDFLSEDIRNFALKENWKLITEYHFGGYAKVTAELIDFVNEFKQKTQIPLDPVYTGKMVFGILDLVKRDYFFPKTKILAIHTGGLQGIMGMNILLKKKNLPLLSV